jgi:hypothetical protein
MAGKSEQKGGDYHVSDLADDQVPDPLGDAKLTPTERATVNVDKPADEKSAS